MYCSCFQQDRLVRRLLSAVTYLLGSFGRDLAHMASLVFAFSLQEWAFSDAATVCNYLLNRYKLLAENRCVISYFSLARFQRVRIDGGWVNFEYGLYRGMKLLWMTIVCFFGLYRVLHVFLNIIWCFWLFYSLSFYKRAQIIYFIII